MDKYESAIKDIKLTKTVFCLPLTFLILSAVGIFINLIEFLLSNKRMPNSSFEFGNLFNFNVF